MLINWIKKKFNVYGVDNKEVHVYYMWIMMIDGWNIVLACVLKQWFLLVGIEWNTLDIVLKHYIWKHFSLGTDKLYF